MQEVFQPLEIFHDGHGSLILVVREGFSTSESYLVSYNIDTERMRSEKISQRHFKHSFKSSLRTRSNLILSSENSQMFALSPKTLETKLQWEGKDTPTGLNDDYLLNSKNEIVDLNSVDLEWQKI
jgi:hypothetical protein